MMHSVKHIPILEAKKIDMRSGDGMLLLEQLHLHVQESCIKDIVLRR